MKKICILILLCMMVSGVFASPVIPYGHTRSDGDSFIVGAVSGEVFSKHLENAFIYRIARYYDLNLDNKGVGGSTTSSVLNRLYADVPVPTNYDTHIFNVGYVDLRNNYSKPYVEYTVSDRIKTMISYLRLKEISYDVHGIRYGTWNGDISDNVNDNIKLFHRGNVSIGITRLYKNVTYFEITIDNVTKYANSSIGCDYINGCPTAFEFRGLSGSNHTIMIKNKGGSFKVDWIGTPSNTPPVIIVNGITKFANISSLHDKMVDSTNIKIQQSIADYFDDRVVYCDQDSFDSEKYPYIGPGSDITHPNNLGHMIIARNMIRSM